MPCCMTVPDGVVHELHALAFAADDDVLQFLRGAFADDRARGAVHDEDFVDREAAAAVGAFSSRSCATTPRSEFASIVRTCAC